MSGRVEVDVFHVEPRHHAVHAALVNWADWVRVRPIYAKSPMFRLVISNSRQWHHPHVHDAVDLIAAMQVEKVVASLPQMHADVLRWWYVYQFGEDKFRRIYGLSRDTLLRVCHDARAMVANRMRREMAGAQSVQR